ncbi:MAG: hypothetical protein ACUBOA_05390 [Candidatus Loosdrechtia sp.]|uniref:hypothetical protein n=1 Tax=Candidatus Loosdrechtia sp. TaxID=3101272 RepID=UPI003A6E5EAD|nr:MAG: hypothetical protein QY305_04690 [Candidatus Jettenia sp. AMX2]
MGRWEDERLKRLHFDWLDWFYEFGWFRFVVIAGFAGLLGFAEDYSIFLIY